MIASLESSCRWYNQRTPGSVRRAVSNGRPRPFALVVRNVGGKKYNSGRPDSVIQLTL
jgi:hypothetical protein